jgi:hypothetical protein
VIGRDVAYKGLFPPPNFLPSTPHYLTTTQQVLPLPTLHHHHSTLQAPEHHNLTSASQLQLSQTWVIHSSKTILLTSQQNLHYYHSLPSSWVALPPRTVLPLSSSRRVRLVTALLLLARPPTPASRPRPPLRPSRPSTAFVRTPVTMAPATPHLVLAPAHPLRVSRPHSRPLLVRLRLLLLRALLRRRHPPLPLLLSSPVLWSL